MRFGCHSDHTSVRNVTALTAYDGSAHTADHGLNGGPARAHMCAHRWHAC